LRKLTFENSPSREEDKSLVLAEAVALREGAIALRKE
jgi:hypothetical protein